MTAKTFRFFREDLCTRCGDCFAACPYLELPPEEAKSEISSLIEGGSSLALEVCNTCHTCDALCPENAGPYELVLERWSKRDQGLPTTARLVTPSEPCNIWSSLKALMPADELSLLNSWDDFSPCDEICLTGFYTSVVPYILQSKVLKGLPKIVGSEALFGCAGDIYKTGSFTMVEQITRRLEKLFKEMGVKKVVASMSAEGMVLSEILPRRFGAKFAFEVEALETWLLRRLQEEKIKPLESLDLTVTVHDNCLSKMQEGRLQEINRKIVRRLGCEIIEPRHTRERSLCCGFGAAAAHYRVIDIMTSGYRRLKELEETGADAAVIYCPACLFILTLIKVVAGSSLPLYHPVELVEMATGEKPLQRHERRAWDMIAIISNHLLKCAASPAYRRPFKPAYIAPEITPLPELPRGDRRRTKALAAFYHSPLVQNRLVRTLISFFFKRIVSSYDSRRKRRLGLKLESTPEHPFHQPG